MIKVTYRLIGSDLLPKLVKEFNTRKDADNWISEQINILIIEIETSGVEVLNTKGAQFVSLILSVWKHILIGRGYLLKLLRGRLYSMITGIQ